jgi:hypothetical protein
MHVLLELKKESGRRIMKQQPGVLLTKKEADLYPRTGQFGCPMAMWSTWVFFKSVQAYFLAGSKTIFDSHPWTTEARGLCGLEGDGGRLDGESTA